MTGTGDLDRRITIERFTATRNEFNEPVEVWASLATVWAQRKDSPDRLKAEYLGAGQVSAFLMTYFVVRSSSVTRTVSAIDRIIYDGHIWNIKGTKETSEGRNRFIELTAVRTNNG